VTTPVAAFVCILAQLELGPLVMRETAMLLLTVKSSFRPDVGVKPKVNAPIPEGAVNPSDHEFSRTIAIRDYPR
jgi:hypothetical protein